MERILIIVILMAHSVYLLTGEESVCESSELTFEGKYYTHEEINGKECKSIPTMVVVQIKEIDIAAAPYKCRARVEDIKLCFKPIETCIVLIPQNSSFEEHMLPEDKKCEPIIITRKDILLPVDVTYTWANRWGELKLYYEVYERVDTKENGIATTTMLAPKRETSQATQMNQVGEPIMTIIFGILFGIAVVAFCVLLCRFLKLRKELEIIGGEDETSTNNEATVDVVYSQVLKKKGPNNTSEAEVTVNELYHM